VRGEVEGGFSKAKPIQRKAFRKTRKKGGGKHERRNKAGKETRMVGVRGRAHGLEGHGRRNGLGLEEALGGFGLVKPWSPHNLSILKN